MSSNAAALAANDASSCASAGSRSFVASSSAARWTARREDVVGRLAHVDVVVRVRALAGERRDHLVGVHVRGGARAGLEDVDRELRRRARRRRPRRRRRAIRSARSPSSRPSSPFTRAAAPLIRPSQRTTGDRHRLARDREVRRPPSSSRRPTAAARARLASRVMAAVRRSPQRRPWAGRSLAPQKGDQLAREAHRVVVGEQEAGAVRIRSCPSGSRSSVSRAVSSGWAGSPSPHSSSVGIAICG